MTTRKELQDRANKYKLAAQWLRKSASRYRDYADNDDALAAMKLVEAAELERQIDDGEYEP